jgi:hypothetical protein
MKFRSGFVSNSSSSSFLIPINALKYYQVQMIKDHINTTMEWSKYQENELYVYNEDSWSIDVNEKCVYGWTIMDNFDMHHFLIEIAKVDPKYIHWGDDYTDNNVDLDELNREILQEERKDKLDNIEENYGNKNG